MIYMKDAPECCCKVEVLTTVMNLVNGPEYSNLMACPMKTVIAEVKKNCSDKPGKWRCPG